MAANLIVSSTLSKVRLLTIQLILSFAFFFVFSERNNDLLEHRAQRTEPPTLNILPKVLFEDDIMVVVSKPPYLSIHANGGFHFNSLVGLLLFEMGYNNLHGKQKTRSFKYKSILCRVNEWIFI